MEPITTQNERTAYLILTGMAFCFGGTWVAGAVAVDAAPPFTIAAVVGGAIVLMGLWLVEHRAGEPRPTSRLVEPNAADA